MRAAWLGRENRRPQHPGQFGSRSRDPNDAATAEAAHQHIIVVNEREQVYRHESSRSDQARPQPVIAVGERLTPVRRGGEIRVRLIAATANRSCAPPSSTNRLPKQNKRIKAHERLQNSESDFNHIGVRSFILSGAPSTIKMTACIPSAREVTR